MPVFSQHRFPGLWKAFQYTIGGTIDKRNLCLQHYNGEKTILEIGCSLGNISKAFVGLPDIHFTGLDIDPIVIDHARKHFRQKNNFKFVCQDLRDFAKKKKDQYDYIIFAGMCHHVEDQECFELLTIASETLLKRTGKLIVVEPLIPRPDDSWLVHYYLRLEQGLFLRRGRKLEDLLLQVKCLQIKDKQEILIGATPLHSPVCARFGLYHLALQTP